MNNEKQVLAILAYLIEKHYGGAMRLSEQELMGTEGQLVIQRIGMDLEVVINSNKRRSKRELRRDQ